MAPKSIRSWATSPGSGSAPRSAFQPPIIATSIRSSTPSPKTSICPMLPRKSPIRTCTWRSSASAMPAKARWSTQSPKSMKATATEPVSEPDKKLAQYINEQFKPVVLVINKWDLAKESLQDQAREQGGKYDNQGIMEEYRKYLDVELQHLDYAPIAFITAKEGKN